MELIIDVVVRVFQNQLKKNDLILASLMRKSLVLS